MIVELTRFSVRPDRVDELLAARQPMLEDFRADRAGFVGAELVRLPNDQWLDIVRWSSLDDFAASQAKGANLSGIAAFFGAIEALVSQEQGSLATQPEVA